MVGAGMTPPLKFAKPSSTTGAKGKQDSSRDKVERDAKGRPKIYAPCVPCGGTGKVPSEKTGKPIKCQPCYATGIKGSYYTRTTTFIDVLEDKSNLARWKQRMTAIGLSLDDALMEEARRLVATGDVEVDTVKRALDAVCSRAQDRAGTSTKADIGTALHEVTEDLDAGKDPGFVPEELAAAVASYVEAMRDIEVVAIEQFGVHDGYRVAGTLDRLLRVYGEIARLLRVPEGTRIVGDLKTGRIDYGFAKIPMQVGFYANMLVYDLETHERSPLGGDGQVSRDVGLLIHTPSGGGETALYRLDLAKGWADVALAAQVREARLVANRKASRPEPIRRVNGADYV